MCALCLTYYLRKVYAPRGNYRCLDHKPRSCTCGVSFITGTRVIRRLIHIRSRGVTTDRSPVTTHHVVAYALCSKNVVRVNEAKLHTEVSCTKDTLRGSTPTAFPSVSSISVLASLTVDRFKLFAGSDPHFSTYLRTHEESLKSANNVKIGV